ncbi:MAG: hypothetical protein GXP54_02125 [Deltaproteobacteria bacterium]|nr:hypothetical protein [Deltaproteobacteria bacterium]
MEPGNRMNRLFVLAAVIALMAGGSGSGGEADTTNASDVKNDVTADVLEEVCTPQCAGKECGDDGCNGTCGACEAPKTCNADGKCEEAVKPKDQCLNADDGAVIAADPDAPLAVTGDCVVKFCLANPTLDCVVDCLQNGSDKTDPPITGLALSDGCAACYGASSLCGVDKCLSECIADATAPECGQCLADYCLKDFYYCSGLTPPCDLPTTWDVAAAVSSASVPDDGAMCPDFNGDSQGDNGLAAAASALNDILAEMGTGYDTILFEFVGVTDFTATPVASFTLNGLGGVSDGNDYLVTPLSYDDECKPLIQFTDAKIDGGQMSAGPGDFTLSIPVRGETVQFVLTKGSISGTVAAGVTITDGVIAGILGKAQAEAAVAQLKGICTEDPSIDWCKYVPVIEAALPEVFDLDTDNDGANDAVSMCLKFEAVGAVISGIQPQ